MTRTFEEASREIQANLKRHLENVAYEEFQTSSEESSEEQEPMDENSNEILERVFSSYDIKNQNCRTKEALLQTISSGSCLICISEVKKKDAIWSCQACYCSFHLNCIQRWAQDSIFQQKRDSDQENGHLDLRSRPPPRKKDQNQIFQWGCPKCRHVYSEIPQKYTCYCEKIVDPPFDPWIVPHSCGDTCGKLLSCGQHKCLILCHPGPCPPCPKIVQSGCYCGQTAPATKRCFEKFWSCGKPCGKLLSCGQHKCSTPCHAGECPPCNKKSVQLCKCQKNQKLINCSEGEWQCQEKCQKKLGCGFHRCEIICHDAGDECPPCPLSQIRHCPCGKSQYQLACTVATPTCGDTCGKLLECGSHYCADKCHRGTCGSCLQMVIKRCKCGLKKKEVPCAKEYTCDIKCKKIRDCGRHNCNRKCCNGQNCPECDQPCNKTLACKNHKCVARCHRGSCYPCTLTKEVSCFCGTSRILVPCGMEKTTKPPKCRQKCKIPSDCHHERRTPHACHFGACPPCRQVCEEKLSCGHICPQLCHDKVVVKVEDKTKVSAPWEKKGPSTEIRNLDCPPCQHPVPITCLGGHETSDFPCHMAKPSSCGRSCGRTLACGNHYCERDCHRVKNAPDTVQAGTNCRKCESECLKPRPEGCNHACLRPCHPDPCAPCGQMMKIWCNCGITQLYVKCGEWIAAGEEKKLEMACCQDQCPKIMSCGHRCTLTCHTGECSKPEECKKKVKLYCTCKRKKQEMQCHKSKSVKLKCDEECKQILDQAKAEKEALKKQKETDEERLKREEAERFEARLEGKRSRPRRNRKHASQTEEVGMFQKIKLPLLLFVSAFTTGLLAVYFYFD